MANQVKTTFVGDTKPQDRAVAKLQADLTKYKAQRERDEQALTRLVERQAEQRARAEIRSLQQVQREMERIRREEQRALTERNARIRGGVSTAAGYALGGAVGAGYLATQAIEKAVEQSRANRLLASAATEAGVAQSKLAEANKRFADSVGLSTVAASATTAQIQRLATYAGSPQDVDKLLKSFADLGAARGIGGRDLETLIGTILSGQDEGLNRLGISDPGQLQKAYAESIGKTAEQLTQQEKVQAAVNAVMEKATIFTGAAEARMNSLEGQVAKTSAAWENFTNALSTTFTKAGPVTDFINETSRLLQGLSVDIETVQRKLKEGKTPAQIAREEYSSPSIGDYISAGAVHFGSLGLANLGLFGTAAQNAADPYKVFQRRRNDLTDQIGATAASNAQQEAAAAQQVKPLYQKFLDEWEAGQPERDAAIKKSAEADARTAKEAIEKRADAEKKAAEELKRKLEEIKRAKESLFDSATSGSNNPFINFLGNANREMRSLLETTKNLSPALRAAFVARAQKGNVEELVGLRINNRLDTLSLQEQADAFRRGSTDSRDVTAAQDILKRNPRLQSHWRTYWEGELERAQQQQPQEALDARLRALATTPGITKDLFNQAVVGLASGIDPSLLRPDQREQVSSAFEGEATRKRESEVTATNFYKMALDQLAGAGLKVAIGTGAALDVTINDQTSTGTTAGTSGSVRARYR